MYRAGKTVKRGIECNEEKSEQERASGRRVGLRGIEESIWRRGWRWGDVRVRVCVCEEEEEDDAGEESR